MGEDGGGGWAAAAGAELGELERRAGALLPRPLPRGRDLRGPRAFPREGRARLEAAAAAAGRGGGDRGGGRGDGVCQVCGASGGGKALVLEWELDFTARVMRPRGASLQCEECEAAGDLPGMLSLEASAAAGSPKCREARQRLALHLARVNGVLSHKSGSENERDTAEAWAHEILNRAHAVRVVASSMAWEIQMPEDGLEEFVSGELQRRRHGQAGVVGVLKGGEAKTPQTPSKKKRPRGETSQPRRSARKAQRAP